MKAIIFILTLVFGATTFANFERMSQNIKLPTQLMLEHQTVSAPATAAATTVLNAHTAVVGGETVTVFAAQPDKARNLTVTPGGTTANVVAGNVVVTGKDIRGKVITETLAITSTQSTATTGAKAFSAVTSIVFPAAGASTTWSVGAGTKLGLNKCLAGSGYYIKGLSDGADLTGSTVAADASNISGNTVIPNPAPNGTHVFDLIYAQNWVCD